MNKEVNSSIPRTTLGLAAEYSVAAELCRRGVYAQLTLGHQKKADLLVFGETGVPAIIEVKAKQGPAWPNCKGIHRPNTFLVFVDFANRETIQRPDFFVLSVMDWRQVLENCVAQIRLRRPEKRITITDKNVSVFDDEINKYGNTYQGMGIRTRDVADYRERWDRILVGVNTDPPPDKTS